MISGTWKSTAGAAIAFVLTISSGWASPVFVQISAKDKFERSRIADLGISIEAVRSDSIWGYATEEELKALEGTGLRVLSRSALAERAPDPKDVPAFPEKDSRYRTFAQVKALLQNLQAKNADLAKVTLIGKSVEGREILALHLNSTPEALQTGRSGKPGALFLGSHHGREHLSTEVPLMLAQYLLTHRNDPQIAALLDTRDIWIVPLVNPDGSEWDIMGGKYKYWRKNRRPSDNGRSFGVDLNRNFSYKWGTGGSSKLPDSDTFMGEEPFSEPETRAVRDLLKGNPNIRTLLSFHTYGELVLYPWGYTFDAIASSQDQATFEAMAKAMAGWNGYKAQRSSDLYITSGDTTDWAYGELGVFAFTFELSPKNVGGFYPGPAVIDPTFAANLKPCLYLIDLADDPYRAIGTKPTGWLRNYVQPSVPVSAFWQPAP